MLGVLTVCTRISRNDGAQRAAAMNIFTGVTVPRGY
eukprot:SAG31_NODE_40283_length_281_cov_1.653846_1_plen_35_part_10